MSVICSFQMCLLCTGTNDVLNTYKNALLHLRNSITSIGCFCCKKSKWENVETSVEYLHKKLFILMKQNCLISIKTCANLWKNNLKQTQCCIVK